MALPDTDKGEMSPLSYLKIFFRRKELLIIPAFIGLVLGVCTGILLPKKYESSSVILVEEGKSDNPLFDKLAVSSTVKQRMSAIKESMLGWNSLVQLVKRLKLDREIQTPKEFEELITDIKKNIRIDPKAANIITITYVDKDPEIAQAVVQNITDIFIERNVEVQNQETSDAIVFIEEQLKVYRGKIKSAEIAQLKDQLKQLLYDATDKHPKVKELTDQIKIKENELRTENLEYTEDINLESTSTIPIIREIETALNSIESGGKGASVANITSQTPEMAKDEYYKIMLIEKLDKVRARDAGINNKLYGQLLQRLETAKITQRLQSSKEGTKYKVLDPPRIPLEPAKPNKILVAIGGFAIGIVLGCGLIFSFEFLDKSFIDVEEAKQYLGVPLLGAISKINTEASLKFEREKESWMYSLTFIAGVVIVILTTAISNFLK